MIRFLQAGGILVYPILACSIIGVAIAIERFTALRRASIDTRDFMDTMRQVLRAGRIQEALEICERTDAPVARVVRAGVLRHGRSREEIREAIDDATHLESPQLERYLSGLATCATISPLLGLLGTVQGMIMAFSEIQNRRGQVNPSDLAAGIGTALYTTALGLMVAIPLLVLYNYLTARVSAMVLEMELSSSELLDLLTREAEEEKA